MLYVNSVSMKESFDTMSNSMHFWKKQKDTKCALFTPFLIAAVFKVISAIHLSFSLQAESN